MTFQSCKMHQAHNSRCSCSERLLNKSINKKVNYSEFRPVRPGQAVHQHTAARPQLRLYEGHTGRQELDKLVLEGDT